MAKQMEPHPAAQQGGEVHKTLKKRLEKGKRVRAALERMARYPCLHNKQTNIK